MNKELEEAIITVNEFANLTFIYGGKIALTSEQMKKYQKSIEMVLNYIDNSIPKEAIEKKKLELWAKCPKSSINEFMIAERNNKIEVCEELLEGK